jgi:hypothetical protein
MSNFKKLTYAIISNGNVIFESENIEEIKNKQREFSLRNTGKTVRAVFQALGHKEDIEVISLNYHTANLAFRYAINFLNSSGFDYESDKNTLTIKPKLSGKISFYTQEYFLGPLYNKSHDNQIFDIN